MDREDFSYANVALKRVSLTKFYVKVIRFVIILYAPPSGKVLECKRMFTARVTILTGKPVPLRTRSKTEKLATKENAKEATQMQIASYFDRNLPEVVKRYISSKSLPFGARGEGCFSRDFAVIDLCRNSAIPL